MELFPLNSLTAKQTVIVGELLRDHPAGRVINDDGKPVFVSESGESAIRISLADLSRAKTESPAERPQAK